jgi:hypothetical protein
MLGLVTPFVFRYLKLGPLAEPGQQRVRFNSWFFIFPELTFRYRLNIQSFASIPLFGVLPRSGT